MEKIKVVVGLVVNEQNQIIVAKRPKDKPLGNYWEFPGGKIETGESAEQALSRELYEELGILIHESKYLTAYNVEYAHANVELQFWLVQRFDNEPIGNEGQLVSWVTLAELPNLQFLEGNKKIIQYLINDKNVLN